MISYASSSVTTVMTVPITPIMPVNSGGAITGNGNIVSTVAGNGNIGYINAVGFAARFNNPDGIVADAAGNYYIADAGNNCIRKMTPAGVVTTFAGDTAAGFVDGAGAAARFRGPCGIAIDAAGQLYVADMGNHRIRKISPTGVVTTLAGGGGSLANGAGYTDNVGAAAAFNEPADVAIDASGNALVADRANHCIRSITPAGLVSTVAGNGTPGYINNAGLPANARFNSPEGIAVGANGTIYVADRYNSALRSISASGIVTSVAGNGSSGFSNGLIGRLSYPTDVVVDSNGDLLIADAGNGCIRKYLTQSSLLTTLAGSHYTPNGYIDGVGSAAAFNNPTDLAVGPNGMIMVCDHANQRMRRIDQTGGYTISPPLAQGLFFNASTGVISGTPATVSALGYQVTASNASGTSVTNLSIQSADPFCTQNLYILGCSQTDYIDAFATNGAAVNISSSNSGCNNDITGYSAFPNQPVVAPPGGTIGFTLTMNSVFGQGVKIWVDWNNDNIFQDTIERVYASSTPLPPGLTHSGSFVVPYSATVDTLRMRVRCVYLTTTFTPCSNHAFGEVEDYPFIVKTLPPLTIYNTTPSNNLCQGKPVQLNFTAVGYNTNNVFTAQLSDSSGQFTNPTIIGSLSGTQGGFINAVIPTNMPLGNGYRMRIVSSSPASIGPVSASTFSVGVGPTSAQTTISPAVVPVICSNSSLTFSAPANTGFQYQWLRDSIVLWGATNATYAASVPGTYRVLVTNTQGCSAYSLGKMLAVSNIYASITPAYPPVLCPGDSVTLSNFSSSYSAYQWLKDGLPISNATNSSYTTSTAGAYQVVAATSATGGCSDTSDQVIVTTSNCTVMPMVNNIGPSMNFCKGSPIAITFSASGFKSNNVFTAQLSNKFGSFASPVTLGTLTGSTGGTITANIPASQVAGTGYKIRILTSSPAGVGPTTGTSLTVGANPSAPSVTISPTTTVNVCAGNAATLSAPANGSLQFQWFMGGTPISGATTNTYTTNVAGTYRVRTTNAAGCSTLTTAPGRSVNVVAPPAATFTVTNLSGGSKKLNASTGGAQWQWFRNGTAIVGATNKTYTTGGVSGNYHLVVTKSGCVSTGTPVFVTGNGVNKSVVSGEGDVPTEPSMLSIYPNPSAAGATILIQSDNLQQWQVRVLDASGKLVCRLETSTGAEAAFGESLAPGFYTVEAFANGVRLLQRWVKR